MFSIIIPTGKHPATLKQTLQSIGKAKSGIYEIIIADSYGLDATEALAKEYSATLITTSTVRGEQKIKAAESAKTEWLLFLHPGTALQKGWLEEVNRFTKDSKNKSNGAIFHYCLDDKHPIARQLEGIFRWGNRMVGAGGAQGLLLHRELYNTLGGFRPFPRFEDIDITRRLLKQKKSELVMLRTQALVNAAFYQKHGYIRGAIWQLTGLYFYMLGAPIPLAAKMVEE